MVEWIALLIAGLAVVVSIYAIYMARRTAHANIISIFLREYASQEMYEALVALRNFEDDDGTLLLYLENLATNPKDCDQEEVGVAQRYIDDWGDKIELHRRHVISFYDRAWKLYENGYLSKKAFLIIGRTSGNKLLFRIVRPLNCATHLINVCKGDPEEYRNNPPRLEWLDEFSKVVSSTGAGIRTS